MAAGVDERVQEQLRLREAQYTTRIPITVFCGSWNVNGKDLDESLDKWLIHPADIYAIGFQELDLTAETFVFNNSNKATKWQKRIETAISKMGSYVHVRSEQLVGILISIYVSQKLVEAAKIDPNFVYADHAGVGVMGIMGNKGGVGVTLKVFNTRMTFVCSHLAAGQSKVSRRNNDYHEICKRLSFGPEGSVNRFGIFDTDLLFWLGDLNYRIDLAKTEVRRRAAAKDWGALLQRDQLLEQRAKGLAFAQFSEGPINFVCTYKYDPGTNTFDTSEKQRIPSWTDRVLWVGEDATQLSYETHPGMLQSDHKPVSATFAVVCKKLEKKKLDGVREAIRADLALHLEGPKPEATVDNSIFAFKDLRFDVPQTQKVTLTNTGATQLAFFFQEHSDEKNRISKSWIEIEPTNGRVAPGESVTLTITAAIDLQAAVKLARGADTIDDELHLHIVNGRNFVFIIQGNYLQTCYGASFYALTRCTGPARVARLQQLDTSAAPAIFEIPKELWRLVDATLKSGKLETANLFFERGSAGEMAEIREALDLGRDLLWFTGSIHSLAETLLQFLETAAEPAIPSAFLARALGCCESKEACTNLVDELPDEHYNVFWYVVAFMRELMRYGAKNGITAKKAPAILAGCMMREPTNYLMKFGGHSDQGRMRRKILFLRHFLKAPAPEAVAPAPPRAPAPAPPPEEAPRSTPLLAL